MQLIGKRISVLTKDDLLSIVILPTTEKKKTGIMFLWLLAWTVCGLIVLANYGRLQRQDEKLFVIIFMSFWAYFEFKIARAFMWKRFGKEKLWIQNGVVHYQREVNGRGKIKEYELELVNDFKEIEVNEGNFSDFINQSFWIKGGERLEFSCQSKQVRFGMQLTDKETSDLMNVIKKHLKQKNR